MLYPLLLIILGFAGLLIGAKWLVEGSTSLAKKNNVSDLVIGLTIVAFGTSAPEMVVNAVASYEGHSSIVLANVIGSNNFTLFVILGTVGLIYPVAVSSETVKREIPIALLGTILVFVLANEFFLDSNKEISRVDGFFIFAAFLGFLYIIFRSFKSETPEVTPDVQMSTLKIWAMIIFGLLGLILGGKLVVDNSIIVASTMGLSQKIIGITIIAMGTSAPELVTSIVAALQKKTDIVIGNVIGSIIFNLLLVLSVSSFVNPIQFAENFNTDLSILICGIAVLILMMFTGKRKKLDRWEAFIFVSFYLVYTGFLISKEL